MHKRLKLIFIPILVAILLLRIGFNQSDASEHKEYEVLENSEKESIAGARSYWGNRVGKYDSDLIFSKAVKKARKQLKSIPRKRSLGLTWEELGPNNIGGRARSILIDNENPNLLFAGGVSGGLWYSDDEGLTWNPTTPGDDEDVLTVNCITQDKDGYIYYGTGEGVFYGVNETAPGLGAYGFRGRGIYKSITPHGTEFEHLPDSWFGKESGSIAVNALATDTLGNVYAAVKNALYKSSDNGNSWTAVNSLSSGATVSGIAYDVKATPNGVVFAAIGNEYYKSMNGTPNSFERISGLGKTLPSSKGRSTFAIAPSNPNVLYVVRATFSGIFDGLYKSADQGDSWQTIIGGSSAAFAPFKGGAYQGDFNQCLAVFPDNPDRILLGGIDLYEWQEGGNWEKKSDWSATWGDHNYIHADHHTIVFHPTDPNKYYIGTDGGVFRTKNQGEIYERLNRGFNVTQFYSVGFGADGVVIGGTQDNSNIYIDFQGNTKQSGDIHNQGDGGFAEISNLYPDAFFIESQYGKLVRGNTRQDDYSEFFYHPQSPFEVFNNFKYDNLWNEFIAPFKLWESGSDELVPDSVTYVANQALQAGDFITVNSDIPLQKFNYQVLQNISIGDTLTIKNPQQSLLAYGSRNALYIVRNHLSFGDSTEWIELTKKGCSLGSRGPTCFTFSADGDILYYGTNIGEIYRVSNLSQVVDDQTKTNAVVTKIGEVKTDANANAYITDITVDPNNADNLIFSVGRYDESVNIYAYNNATSTAATNEYFPINGNLPQIPVYAALIEYNSGAYIIGTEYGVFSSEDGGNTWSKDFGIPNCPVVQLRQQTFKWAENFGQIFMATHGRGLFTSENYVTSTQDFNTTQPQLNPLEIYPNPVDNILNTNLTPGVRRNFQIFNNSGKLVYQITQTNNTLNLPTFASGRYTLVVQNTAGGKKVTCSFIKK